MGSDLLFVLPAFLNLDGLVAGEGPRQCHGLVVTKVPLAIIQIAACSYCTRAIRLDL